MSFIFLSVFGAKRSFFGIQRSYIVDMKIPLSPLFTRPYFQYDEGERAEN